MQSPDQSTPIEEVVLINPDPVPQGVDLPDDASTNGAAVYGRGPAPATREFLQVLATSDGLVDVTTDGTLSLSVGGESVALSADAVRDHRDVIERELA